MLPIYLKPFDFIDKMNALNFSTFLNQKNIKLLTQRQVHNF